MNADNRDTGIAPASLQTHNAVFVLDEFERAPATELIQPETQAYLPGLTPEPGVIVSPLPFLIWYGSRKEGRGRGAPYGLRIWVEAVLSVPADAREVRRMPLLLWGDLVDAVLGKRGFRPNQLSMLAALDNVHNLRFVYGDPGGFTARAVVMVQDRPLAWNQYDAPVRMIIELPPGSGNGPSVYKPFLREIGRLSAPGFRAELNLCYLWDRFGATKGRYIQQTRPRLARRSDGLLLDANGRVLLLKGGQPRPELHDRQERQPTPAPRRCGPG